MILLPEVPFEQEKFLARVKQCVTDCGYCVIVVSEGAAYADGRFLADAGTKDAFGHTQLGGVAPVVANMVREAHGYKYHWAVADYLQRSARHIASRVDVEQAYAVGKAAVELGIRGVNAVMPTIVRKSSRPYRWSIGHVPLSEVANQEKKLPRAYIRADGFGISEACRRYLEPLIAGEAYPPYKRACRTTCASAAARCGASCGPTSKSKGLAAPRLISGAAIGHTARRRGRRRTGAVL